MVGTGLISVQIRSVLADEEPEMPVESTARIKFASEDYNACKLLRSS